MIGEWRAKEYCCEDISKIENYDKAIADKTQKWHCHHRAEILPCGRFSRDDLMKFGLYYNRPACELIFLTSLEHHILHHTGNQYHKGKKHSSESIQKMRQYANNMTVEHCHKMSEAAKRRTGTKYWNNGVVCVRIKECPPGFVRGRLKRKLDNANSCN